MAMMKALEEQIETLQKTVEHINMGCQGMEARIQQTEKIVESQGIELKFKEVKMEMDRKLKELQNKMTEALDELMKDVTSRMTHDMHKRTKGITEHKGFDGLPTYDGDADKYEE